MENGKWINGKWKMENGKWRMKNRCRTYGFSRKKGHVSPAKASSPRRIDAGLTASAGRRGTSLRLKPLVPLVFSIFHFPFSIFHYL
jgi:hypothetical protein